MSVTLKLADEDAAVVGSILKAFSQEMAKGASLDAESTKYLFSRLKAAAGSRTPQHISDIAGAFQIAVRANQR